MKIYVDADACPVKELVEKIAKEFKLDVIYVVDYNHVITTSYGQVIVVDQGKDSVDIGIINRLNHGDIVISQDYGVASMVLAKKGYCMNQNGLEYTNDNIDQLLLQRHEAQRGRRSNKRMPQHKKRSVEDDSQFETNFRRLVSRVSLQNGLPI